MLYYCTACEQKNSKMQKMSHAIYVFCSNGNCHRGDGNLNKKMGYKRTVFYVGNINNDDCMCSTNA